MKYEKLMEHYRITKNDGSGPFEREVEGIFMNYCSGKPTYAVLILNMGVKDPITHTDAGVRKETDPSKLAKIVDFFHQK